MSATADRMSGQHCLQATAARHPSSPMTGRERHRQHRADGHHAALCFHIALIAAAPLPRRLKELRNVSEHLAIAHAKDLNDALRTAYETRNRMAHQPVTIDPSDPFRVFNSNTEPLLQEELHASLMRLVSAAETIDARIGVNANGNALGCEVRIDLVQRAVLDESIQAAHSA